ncbi:NYN domain-containing protein [Candidatus Poriferisocius sp.]|uniref:NYN domain-containing protein n=1 Tax=Candidatus Poriferisocius sp. TaxID=3101276 RepID=UPI003B023AE9
MSQRPQPQTIVNVDGFNFYYGALKGNPDLKWLDYRELAVRLLRGHHVEAVKYFTARVQDRRDDRGLAQRLGVYIRALEEHSGVEVHLGQFKHREKNLPLVRGYRSGKIKMARVVHTEEKGSDVSLGAHLVRGACHKNMDVALVFSNDSDLQTPATMAEGEGIAVVTVNPHKQSEQPRRLLSGDKRTLKRKLLEQCQLPDPVIGVKGSKIHRPKEWRA